MSVYSMTGYASAQERLGTEGESLRAGLEIRSVNSRFLDLAFKLPEECRHLEPALRERLGQALRRGKVELRAYLEHTEHALLHAPDAQWLDQLAAVQARIRQTLPQARELGVADVLRLSGGGSAARPEDALWLQLANQAIAELKAAREREGRRLVHMLQGHIEQLRQLARQAAPLVPQLVEQQRQRFLERWQDALHLGGAAQAGAAMQEAARERALSEATAFAIRIDVAEELTRLQAHLEEISQMLASGGELGKRLDFLIQELHREANTLGSKSAVLEMTRISVDMKVLIEQMREQVQNIE